MLSKRNFTIKNVPKFKSGMNDSNPPDQLGPTRTKLSGIRIERKIKMRESLFWSRKCLKEFILTWTTCFKNTILVHLISIRNLWFTRPNPVLVHFSIVGISDFGPDSEYWYSKNLTIEKWTKIGFTNQVHHVRMNSYKHFYGPKRGPVYKKTECNAWIPRSNILDRMISINSVF